MDKEERRILDLSISEARETFSQLDREIKTQLSRIGRRFASEVDNLETVHSSVEDSISSTVQIKDQIEQTHSKATRLFEQIRRIDKARTRVHSVIETLENFLGLKEKLELLDESIEFGNLSEASSILSYFNSFPPYTSFEDGVDLETLLKGRKIALVKLAEEAISEVRDEFNTASALKLEQVKRMILILQVLILAQDSKEKAFDMVINLARISTKRFNHSKVFAMREARSPTLESELAIHFNTLVDIFDNSAIALKSIAKEASNQLSNENSLALLLQTNRAISEQAFSDAVNVISHLQNSPLIKEVSGSNLGSEAGWSALQERVHGLDVFLNGTMLIVQQCELFSAFVQKRFEFPLRDEKLTSEFRMQVGEIVNSYSILEREFVSLSFELARENRVFFSDERENGCAVISSLVDEVFFVVRRALVRAGRSGNSLALSQATKIASDLISESLFQIFENLETQSASRPPDWDNRSLAIVLKHIGEGNEEGRGTPISEKDLLKKIDEERSRFLTQALKLGEFTHIFIFLVGANEAFQASNFIQELTDNLDFFKKAENLVESSVAEFRSLAVDLSGIGKRLIETVANSILKRLKFEKEISEVWRIKGNEAWMTISEIDNASSAGGKALRVIDTLVNAIKDQLGGPIKQILDIEVYGELVKQISSYVAKEYLNGLLKSSFTYYGGIIAENHVRKLMSTFQELSWNSEVRQSFRVLIQATSVLCLERVSDLLGVYNTVEWILSRDEIKRIMGLRQDLRKEEIEKLRL